MDILLGYTILGSLIAIIAGIVMFLPFTDLKPKRKLARNLFIGGWGVLILGCLALPHPHVPTPTPAELSKLRDEEATFGQKISDAPALCDSMGEADYSNGGLDAYNDAKHASYVCKLASTDLANLTLENDLGNKSVGAFLKTRDDCSKAYDERHLVYEFLMEAIDGGKPSAMSTYQDQDRSSADLVTACRAELVATAKGAGMQLSEIDAMRFDDHASTSDQYR